MMPQSSQNLYFHLGMNADDDGFVEHFTVMRMTESKPDDLRVLQAKGFVHVFDEKVLIVRDWQENNYVRSDRYSPSKYLKLYKTELLALNEPQPGFSLQKPAEDMDGIPDGNQMATQVRLGKVRLGKVKRENTESQPQASDSKDIQEVISLFKEVNPSYQTIFARKNQRDAVSRLLKIYPRPELDKIVKALPQTNLQKYWPIITTPLQLEANVGKLKAFIEKERSNPKGKKIISTT